MSKQCNHDIWILIFLEDRKVRINLWMIRSLYESLNVGFPASSTTNEALWNDSRHRSPPVIAQTDCLSLMSQNRASWLLRSYHQVPWWGSLMCFPLCLGQLQSTHAFRRPWSLFRLLLSRLEERENSSSHHTYQHQTRGCHHHPHHRRHYLTAISTLASSSCEAMKLSWLTFTMSDAVTTVTMRFSSRPTRLPTSSSSRSFASYCTTENDCCCC